MSLVPSVLITKSKDDYLNNRTLVTVKYIVYWTDSECVLEPHTGMVRIYEPTSMGANTLFVEYFETSINVGQTENGSKILYEGTVWLPNTTPATALKYLASYNGIPQENEGSITLEPISPLSTLAVQDGILGTAQTLNITPSIEEAEHTVTWTCGNESGLIGTARTTETELEFTPPKSLAAQFPTQASVQITITINTYYQKTDHGANSYVIWCDVPSTIYPKAYAAITDTSGLLNEYGKLIVGKSKCEITITSEEAYGAKIVSYESIVNQDEAQKYTTQNFTVNTITFRSITNGNIFHVNTTVVDERGRKGYAYASYYVYDYSAPIISKLSVKRCAADGTEVNNGGYVQVIFSSTSTSLDAKNEVSYTLKYKKTSESSYTSVSLSAYENQYTVDDVSYIFQAETGSSYDVLVEVNDSLSITTRTTRASTAMTLMHWLASGLGLAIGKIAELAGVLDIGFKTRFDGGLLHPVLSRGTDLNDVRTPNTYAGLASHGYMNCPITSGTFVLEVFEAGDENQVKQQAISCSKSNGRVYERFYNESGWSEWGQVLGDSTKTLWSGSQAMNADHTCNLNEAISNQKIGISLVFKHTDDNATYYSSHFIPKTVLSAPDAEYHTVLLNVPTAGIFGSKILQITDNTITGHDNNRLTYTNNGVTFSNSSFILVSVIGV